MSLLAQVKSGGIGIKPPPYGLGIGPPGSDFLSIIIRNAVTIIFAIAMILVLFMLLWGGIDWIMSSGDKEKVGNARRKITSALIGLIILAFAFVILRLVGGIFGFDKPLQIPSLNTL